MLDDLEKIAKLDKGNILSSIEHLPEQVDQAWKDTKYLALPKSYSDVKNIVVAGMGGSALGGRIVHHLEAEKLRAPIEVVTSYKLPNYVNKDSLVILSSYSGNTEETVSATYGAIDKNACVVGIATGGKLAEILKNKNLPIYVIEPRNNPSGQPRMGLGYSIASILGILDKCKLLNLTDEDLGEIVDCTEKFVKEYGVRNHTSKNPAKKMAEKLVGKIPVLMSSEHLVGVTHAFKNQLNENAKTFSVHFPISEANHHLMDALRFPQKAKEILHFVFLESRNYYPRFEKIYSITEDVVKKNGSGYEVYRTLSKKKVEEVFEILVFGSYVSFYSAMLHGIDPTPIPWVDFFKEELK